MPCQRPAMWRGWTKGDLRDAHARLVPVTELNNVQPGQSMFHQTSHAGRAELNHKQRPKPVQTELNRLTPPTPPLTKLNNVPAMVQLHQAKLNNPMTWNGTAADTGTPS